MPKSRGRKKKKGVEKLKLSPEADAVIRRRLQEFREKFGREPGPEDPIFFDSSSTSPDPVPMNLSEFETQVAEAMRKANVAPQIIYAFKKTGLIVTEASRLTIPADRRAEWEAAIDDYFRLEYKKLGEG
jgi:hypothetical protein